MQRRDAIDSSSIGIRIQAISSGCLWSIGKGGMLVFFTLSCQSFAAPPLLHSTSTIPSVPSSNSLSMSPLGSNPSLNITTAPINPNAEIEKQLHHLGGRLARIAVCERVNSERSTSTKTWYFANTFAAFKNQLQIELAYNKVDASNLDLKTFEDSFQNSFSDFASYRYSDTGKQMSDLLKDLLKEEIREASNSESRSYEDAIDYLKVKKSKQQYQIEDALGLYLSQALIDPAARARCSHVRSTTSFWKTPKFFVVPHEQGETVSEVIVGDSKKSSSSEKLDAAKTTLDNKEHSAMPTSPNSGSVTGKIAQKPILKKPGTNAESKKDDGQKQIVVTGESTPFPTFSGQKIPSRGWKTEYTVYLKKRIPDSFIKNPPKDITKLCPRYNELSLNQKREAWAHVIKSIAYSETKHIPNLRFREGSHNDAVTGSDVYSEGLLQVSYQDARYYGCRFDWSQDRKLRTLSPNKTIFDPYRNLDCGVRILSRQFAKGIPLVAVNRSHYWSTLNPRVKSPKHWGLGALAHKMSEFQACGLSRASFSSRFSSSIRNVGRNIFAAMWPQ